jgi:hypothetical protein
LKFSRALVQSQLHKALHLVLCVCVCVFFFSLV